MAKQERLNEEALYAALEDAAQKGDVAEGRRVARPLFAMAVASGTLEGVTAALYIYKEFFPQDAAAQWTSMIQQIIDRGLPGIMGSHRIVLSEYLKDRGVSGSINTSVFGKLVKAEYVKRHGKLPRYEYTTLPFGRPVPVAVYTEIDKDLLDFVLKRQFSRSSG